MPRIAIEGLTVAFGPARRRVTAVDDLTLTVEDGELLVLLGPSGCGKTTTLRSVAGLEEPSSGSISFGEKVVFDSARRTNPGPHRRDIGMVFQSYALWPHMTVRDNIAYPLRARRRKDALRSGAVDRAAELVDCGGLLDRHPGQLSGGQQQRVSLARALVSEPTVMLFDEPLSNLDAQLRDQLRADIHRLHGELGFTGIYVTHDQSEALAVGDRLAIMKHGQLEQLDTPTRLFNQPASEYAAAFLGVRNHVELARSAGGWSSTAGDLVGVFPDYAADVVRVRLRSEDLTVSASAPPLGNVGIERATVVDVSFGGRTHQVELQVADGSRLTATVPVSQASESLRPGSLVSVGWEPLAALAYDAEGRPCGLEARPAGIASPRGGSDGD